MKRQITYLLILSLAIPFFCTEVVINLQIAETRKDVKQKMIQGMDLDELVELQFSADELSKLNWIKSHEFEYKGLMYDVVETHENADSTTFICFPDHQETALNKELDRLRAIAHQSDIPRQKTEFLVTNFFKHLFPFELHSQIQMAEYSNEIQLLFSSSILSVDIEKDTPPPRL